MKTDEFWAYCDRLRDTRSGNKKQDIISDVIIENEHTDVEYALRLMLGNPFDDAEKSMGVGKKTVRKALTKVYDTNYDEVREIEKELGNLSEVSQSLTRPEGLTTPDRSDEISELIQDLDDLQDSGTNLVSRVADVIDGYEDSHVAVYGILCPKKDVALGIGWKKVRDACASIFSLSSERFERLHGIGYDAPNIAAALKIGSNLDPTLRPLMRIRPMLASSANIPEDGVGWVGQTKFDGGRLLIHNYHNTTSEGILRDQQNEWLISAYTRQRHEISDNLPEINEVDWPDSQFIIDTEAVGYNPETGEPMPFQKFMERFQREKNVDEKAEEIEIDFRIFDLLYWDGEDMTDDPFSARFGLLKELFPEDMVAETYDDIERAYKEALEMGHEGIIAKEKEHEYQFGRSRSWRKRKPVKEPADVRVRGVVPGTGERQGTLGSLKLETQDGAYVGRVGTGFTDPELDDLWEMHQNEELVGSVVEVEFEEFQENDGKYGLRFPRYLGLRPDGEADSLERIKSL